MITPSGRMTVDGGDLNQLSTGKESAYSAWTMVSGAAYCNGRYYASAVDVPISAALLVTDVNSGKTQILDWEAAPPLICRICIICAILLIPLVKPFMLWRM